MLPINVKYISMLTALAVVGMSCWAAPIRAEAEKVEAIGNVEFSGTVLPTCTAISVAAPFPGAVVGNYLLLQCNNYGDRMRIVPYSTNLQSSMVATNRVLADGKTPRSLTISP
jgi:type 1 fimbria pilin